MAKPFARHEDRAADVEAERVVLERRAVTVTHQEADQALVRRVHLVLMAGERDSRAVDDREVVGHRVVEAHEAVVEESDRLLGADVGRHGHGRRDATPGPGRTVSAWRSASAPQAGRIRRGGRVSTRRVCSRPSSSASTPSGSTTVELNATGYRLPSEDQFKRWAESVPDGFKFAVKLPLTRLDRVTPFLERAQALGDRLGPIRVVVEAARDDGLVSFVTGSTPA